MLRLVRIALLVFLAFLMISGVVLGFGNDTGPVEKLILIAYAGVLIFAAFKVNKLGAHLTSK